MRESLLKCVLVRLYECVVLLTASAGYLPYPTIPLGGFDVNVNRCSVFGIDRTPNDVGVSHHE
jgi:hypothetical protein